MKFHEDIRISTFNTPDRCQRIDKFKMKISVKSVEGQNTIVFTTSEPIVVSMEAMNRINSVIEKDVAKNKGISIYYISQNLTKLVRNMLLYCQVFFEGEVDCDIYLGDTDILRMDKAGFTKHTFKSE